MAKKDSTGYIIMFAAGVCLVCSVIVSGAAVALKPQQEANKVVDRQEKVLSVAGLVREGEQLTPAQVGERFETRIKPRIVDLGTGEYADEAVDPTTYDQREAAKDPARSEEAPDNKAKVQRLPEYALVYHVLDPKGKEVEKLILPIQGKGLWSTLYGYIALQPDTTTIAGLTFYEHGETPGLGGEVDNPSWKAKWKGRKVYDDEWNPEIRVIKGAAGPASEEPYKVDGLSGATLTSNGVTHALQFWLGDSGFAPYLENVRKEGL